MTGVQTCALPILSISKCDPTIEVWQSMHAPQPMFEQTRAAAKALAAVDLPEPDGPVKSHEWVILWLKSLFSRAAITALFKVSITCDWPTIFSKIFTLIEDISLFDLLFQHESWIFLVLRL